MAHEVEPKPRGDSPQRRSGGLRPLHTLAVVAVGVVGVLIAFWVLKVIAHLILGILTFVVVVALIGGLVWLLVGRRRT